jgi:hypothetical protein
MRRQHQSNITSIHPYPCPAPPLTRRRLAARREIQNANMGRSARHPCYLASIQRKSPDRIWPRGSGALWGIYPGRGPKIALPSNAASQRLTEPRRPLGEGRSQPVSLPNPPQPAPQPLTPRSIDLTLYRHPVRLLLTLVWVWEMSMPPTATDCHRLPVRGWPKKSFPHLEYALILAHELLTRLYKLASSL